MAKKSIQRTTAELRARGWMYEITERWNQYDHKRHDLFAFIDIVVLSPCSILAIQTGIGGHAAHRDKILSSPEARQWLISGGRVQIWTWRKVKLKRGSKALRWNVKIEEIRLKDFEECGR